MQKKSRIKQILHKLSGKTEMNTGTPQPVMPSQEDTQLRRFYQHIIDLPLRHFITCVVDGNLSALIISGYPSQEELLSAWIEIQQEYSDMSGDSENRLYWELFKEVKLLTIDFETVQLYVELLEKVHHQRIVDELNEILGTTFPLDWNDQVQYRKDLQRCLNRSKAIKINIDLKSVELAELKKVQEKGEKPSREYYATCLVRLTKYAQAKLDDMMTVFDFCTWVKDYNAYCKMLNDQATKK